MRVFIEKSKKLYYMEPKKNFSPEDVATPMGMNIPKFEVPYDVVSLPSQGVLYKNVPQEIEVEYMTGKDEDVLTSPKIINSGKALDILLKRKVRNKDIDLDQLCTGDKVALLLALRIGSYGDAYPAEFTDPKTGQRFTQEINLGGLKKQELSEKPDEKMEFSFVLPKTQKTVKFRILSARENEDIRIAAEKKAAEFDQDVVETLSSRLKAQVMEIDGERNKMYISQAIEYLPAMDTKALRKHIRSIEPGIEMSAVVTAPSGESFKTVIPINLQFFWPD